MTSAIDDARPTRAQRVWHTRGLVKEALNEARDLRSETGDDDPSERAVLLLAVRRLDEAMTQIERLRR